MNEVWFCWICRCLHFFNFTSKKSYWVNWTWEYTSILKWTIIRGNETELPNLLKFMCLKGKFRLMTSQDGIFSYFWIYFSDHKGHFRIQFPIPEKNHENYCTCSSLSFFRCCSKIFSCKFSILCNLLQTSFFPFFILIVSKILNFQRL